MSKLIERMMGGMEARVKIIPEPLSHCGPSRVPPLELIVGLEHKKWTA